MEKQITFKKGTKRDLSKLKQQIQTFNLSQVPSFQGKEPWQCFTYVLKGPRSKFLGGICGYVYMAHSLAVDILWIDPQYRGQGYGAQLLQTLEEMAIVNGARLAHVDTFDFQALGFYQKYGFEVFGVLEDCPKPGNKRYYLKKRLFLAT